MLVEGCFQVSEEKRRFLRTLTRHYLIFRERQDDQNSKEEIKVKSKKTAETVLFVKKPVDAFL